METLKCKCGGTAFFPAHKIYLHRFPDHVKLQYGIKDAAPAELVGWMCSDGGQMVKIHNTGDTILVEMTYVVNGEDEDE